MTWSSWAPGAKNSYFLLADTGLAGECGFMPGRFKPFFDSARRHRLAGECGFMPVDRFLRTFPFFLDCWVVWATGNPSIEFEIPGFGVRTIAKFLNHWLGDGTNAKFSFAVICPDPGKILNPGHCGREGLKRAQWTCAIGAPQASIQ